MMVGDADFRVLLFPLGHLLLGQRAEKDPRRHDGRGRIAWLRETRRAERALDLHDDPETHDGRDLQLNLKSPRGICSGRLCLRLISSVRGFFCLYDDSRACACVGGYRLGCPGVLLLLLLVLRVHLLELRGQLICLSDQCLIVRDLDGAQKIEQILDRIRSFFTGFNYIFLDFCHTNACGRGNRTAFRGRSALLLSLCSTIVSELNSLSV